MHVDGDGLGWAEPANDHQLLAPLPARLGVAELLGQPLYVDRDEWDALRRHYSPLTLWATLNGPPLGAPTSIIGRPVLVVAPLDRRVIAQQAAADRLDITAIGAMYPDSRDAVRAVRILEAWIGEPQPTQSPAERHPLWGGEPVDHQPQPDRWRHLSDRRIIALGSLAVALALVAAVVYLLSPLLR